MTESQVRDAVAFALLPVALLPVDWVPGSPVPHPVRKGIIERRRPATMAVRWSDLRAVSISLVHSKEFCCVAVFLIICFSICLENEQGMFRGEIFPQLVNLLDEFRL